MLIMKCAVNYGFGRVLRKFQRDCAGGRNGWGLETICDYMQRSEHQPLGHQASGSATDIRAIVDDINASDGVSDHRIHDKTNSGFM